jgi:hypothetical protein
MTATANPPTTPRLKQPQLRARFGLITAAIGLAIFILGSRPSLFGLDRSPIVGFVQIAVFEVGLGIICLGGFVSMISLWGNQQRSIRADIGLRIVATGYIVSFFSGMADVFGFGSHPLPGVPYFGPLQAMGVELGEALIVIGFLLVIPLISQIKSQTRPR